MQIRTAEERLFFFFVVFLLLLLRLLAEGVHNVLACTYAGVQSVYGAIARLFDVYMYWIRRRIGRVWGSQGYDTM